MMKMKHFKALCVLLILAISNVTAIPVADVEKLFMGLTSRSPALYPSDLEVNGYLSMYNTAKEAGNVAALMEIGDKYIEYEFQRKNLLRDIDNMMERADNLLKHPRLPENLKPVVQYLKKSMETQKVEANNQQLVGHLREYLNIFAEILLSVGPDGINATTAFPRGPLSAIATPATPVAQNPFWPNWPIPSPRTNLLDLTTEQLRKLKNKLDELESDEDIFGCLFDIFG